MFLIFRSNEFTNVKIRYNYSVILPRKAYTISYRRNSSTNLCYYTSWFISLFTFLSFNFISFHRRSCRITRIAHMLRNILPSRSNDLSKCIYYTCASSTVCFYSRNYSNNNNNNNNENNREQRYRTDNFCRNLTNERFEASCAFPNSLIRVNAAWPSSATFTSVYHPSNIPLTWNAAHIMHPEHTQTSCTRNLFRLC